MFHTRGARGPCPLGRSLQRAHGAGVQARRPGMRGCLNAPRGTIIPLDGEALSVGARRMWLVRSALKNPYFIVVMALGVLIVGVTAVTRIPTDILPLFKTPAVQVLSFYPGMPAEIMEKDITSRISRWTGQSNGIARQESKSMIGVSVVKDFFREA